MSTGLEVKANLPGPLAHLSILPSNNAVQLIGPGATIWKSMIKTDEREKNKGFLFFFFFFKWSLEVSLTALVAKITNAWNHS